jgi:hypothetical protein
MPGYRGHLAGGCVVYTILLFAVHNTHPSLPLILGLFVATCAGALFPDIDIKSKGQKYFYWGMLVLLGWSIWRFKQLNTSGRFDVVAGLAIVALLPLLVRHRGITHQPWFIMVLSFGLWVMGIGFFPLHSSAIFLSLLFFVAGALSHIWLDKGL